MNFGGPDEIRTHDPRRVKGLLDGVSGILTPEYQGQKPPNATKSLQAVLLNDLWTHHRESFKNWLNAKDVSKTTKRDYYNALKRFFSTESVQRPQDFRKLDLRDKEERGLRNLLNYFEDEDVDDVCGHTIQKWRRYIKIKKSNVFEVYVTDEEIQEAYESYPEDLKPIYKLLMYSGNRLSHVHKMLKTFDERNIVVDGEVAHYPSAAFSSGTKKTFQIYFPSSFITTLKSIDKVYGYDCYAKRIRYNRVCAKTIRKWHLNLMIKEGVTESLADFIQGRAPATVGSAHYLNKVQQSKEAYRKIVGNFGV
ncbi:integrase [uncultured Methanolobus sp.]|uniref:integrase n=1 Tax=uncultured Methanolobus sp. TaxID=218300 RepID=UPI0029C81334|nr:integrase [uncultured Methanolobus sp.]